MLECGMYYFGTDLVSKKDHTEEQFSPKQTLLLLFQGETED